MTLILPKLYRVQHSTSFTHHANHEGFRAKGTYWMDYSHWFNPRKVTKHLDWKDRSLEPSPFISFFDNLKDTQMRASFHRKAGCEGVFVAEIDISNFTPYCLRIEFLEGPIELNGLLHTPTTTMLFPLVELRSKFHLDFRIIQSSEWIALSYIPPEIVTYTNF
ncbi:uncharacterized protein K444DRAFT_607727 [Hyaloscypha bicolor E]|uniref:DUF7587 domain-containing protein n=1 Tax=Hyaloscypha bicolor E TaxID=1095630 RepID=A0A2J6TTE5_9HELO|nr:uncharacterized protein K444DRAFT_607727 [Hyaloscypha bicolor E]PMD66302.1 hypothetical protein K444DRAFT_607727 [Hyaloscypha bicolor E]